VDFKAFNMQGFFAEHNEDVFFLFLSDSVIESKMLVLVELELELVPVFRAELPSVVFAILSVDFVFSVLQ
jgi:hypothetical protein